MLIRSRNCGLLVVAGKVDNLAFRVGFTYAKHVQEGDEGHAVPIDLVPDLGLLGLGPVEVDQIGLGLCW